MAGGLVDMWGTVRGPTWTHLNGNVNFAATTITVEEDVQWYERRIYITNPPFSIRENPWILTFFESTLTVNYQASWRHHCYCKH